MKHVPTAYMLLFLTGLFGGHWFYLGRPAIGILYLCTAGLCGIGVFVDFFNLPDHVRHASLTS